MRISPQQQQSYADPTCLIRSMRKVYIAFGRRGSPLLRNSRVAQNNVGIMINDEGENIDLYIPRKCAWTNKLITAKDHAAVQLNIGHLNEEGMYSGSTTTYAFSGSVRAMGASDSALDRLWKEKNAEQ